MTKIFTSTAVLVCIAVLLSFRTENMEKKKIEQSITDNYIHGAFNETNIEKFRSVFHQEFSIINIQEDGSFFNFTRDMWEEALKQRKQDSNFDYGTVAFRPVFKHIDITGDKASVSMDLLLHDKVIYSDYLLLCKVDQHWKIVSKVFYEHD